MIPIKYPILAAAILPVVHAAAIVIGIVRRRRKAKPGHCAKCGYDLRASKERCPECGAAFVVPP